MDRREILSVYDHFFYSDASGHLCRLRGFVQPVFFHDLPHILLLLIVEFPFFHQGTVDRIFRLCIDDVHNHGFLLQETIAAVNRLDKIMELIIDADKNLSVAVILEITADAGKAFLCGEQSCSALREINHALFPLFIIHGSVDIHDFRHEPLQLFPFRFPVMPQNEVCIRIAVNDLFCFPAPCFNALFLLPGSLLQTGGSIVHQLILSVFVDVFRVLVAQAVRSDFQLRQGIAFVVITEVRRFGDEQRPG